MLGWFKEWVGYPPEATGSLVTGGSAANLTALVCAREARAGAAQDDLVVYVSDQAHSSVARALRIVGFRPDQVRVLPVGDDLRLEPATLAAAIDADERAGRLPFFVVANAGATSSGAIDPLPELAELCRRNGLWLHVDAAYGGFAVLTERGRRALAGNRARRLDHARPAQVALPAVRVWLPARARRPGTSRRVRDQLRLPPRR